MLRRRLRNQLGMFGLAVAGGGDTALVRDSFDRPNSAISLGTADSGQVWSAEKGTWGINNNQGYLAVHGGGPENNVAILDCGVSAYSVRCAITQAGATPGITTNYFDLATFVKVVIDGVNIYVDRYIASAWARLATITPITWNAGDVLRVDISGATWAVYQNDVLMGSNSNLPVGVQGFSKVGMNQWNGLNSRWDDFVVYAL